MREKRVASSLLSDNFLYVRSFHFINTYLEDLILQAIVENALKNVHHSAVKLFISKNTYECFWARNVFILSFWTLVFRQTENQTTIYGLHFILHVFFSDFFPSFHNFFLFIDNAADWAARSVYNYCRPIALPIALL